MPRSRVGSAALFGLWLGLSLCQAGSAWAGAFTVNPIRVVFSPDTHSALLLLHNRGTEALRFQLGVFAWDQSPNGEMQLTPGEDIVFFPSLLTLTPGGTRNVRVGPVTPFAATEKTYRIFIEELPPLATPKGGPGGGAHPDQDWDSDLSPAR